MKQDTAVIKPVNPGHWPSCPNRTAVMVSSPADMKDIVRRAGLSGVHPQVFMNSRMYCDSNSPSTICIAGPFTGAPYAAMLMEVLIAWGVERIIVFGWCGSVCGDVGIGDMIVPTSAFSGDGTSPHYCISKGADDAVENRRILPSERLNAHILSKCRQMNLSCRNGPIWTMDAIFRETPEIISEYQDKGALAVEMEAAALFAVGAYRCVEVAAVLAVSDEVHSFSWKTGFGSNPFKETRKNAIELILAVTRELNQECAS